MVFLSLQDLDLSAIELVSLNYVKVCSTDVLLVFKMLTVSLGLLSGLDNPTACHLQFSLTQRLGIFLINIKHVSKNDHKKQIAVMLEVITTNLTYVVVTTAD